MKGILSHITLSLLLLTGFTASAQQRDILFSTQKLGMIADRLQLQGLDTIPFDTDNYASYSYQDKALHIRKDKWGEISHIGLSLFHPVLIASNRPVCDFIERYALEYAVVDAEKRRLLQTEGVIFWNGDIHTLQGMKGTESVSINQRNMRDYHVVWREADRELLTMAFPMDAQLIFGCNAIELETQFIKHVMRYEAGQPVLIENNTAGETFLIDAIRSQLYYKEGELIWDNKEWRKSLYNLIVSGQRLGDYRLSLTIDKYGYKVANGEMPVEQWIQYCQSEGCRIYLGIKEIHHGRVRATAFAANHSLGYCHMLSFSIEQSDLGKKSGSLRGRMYAYIPLHNISNNLFEREYKY